MKKNLLLVIVAIVILVVLVIIFVSANSKTTENNLPGTSAENEGKAQIVLNQETDINTLKDIIISGTNDYFSITEDVKWDVLSADGQTTVSYSVTIPYKFIVDGNEFTGTYILGDDFYKANDDKNPKYDLEITNLTEQGIVTVLIKNK